MSFGADDRARVRLSTPHPCWVLVAVLLLLAGPQATAGKQRKMRSKGVRYSLDLPCEGGKTLSLLIEPANNAWLAAAWGPQSHGVTRMGRGLMWTCFDSTERAGMQAHVYLEAEPLAGKEFGAAAVAYESRLRDIWRHSGRSIAGRVKAKKGKSLKIGKLRVPTYRYTMGVQRVSDGAKLPVLTILFPLADHLVALTAEGAPDYAPKALRTLKTSTPGEDSKVRLQHMADTVRLSTTFFVLKPPPGYRLDPVVPEEDDRTLVARWRRTKERGTPSTMTLMRLSLDKTTPAKAVAYWGRMLGARGEGEADPAASFQIDGKEGSALVWRRRKKDAEPTAWGWMVAWSSGGTMFALQGETGSEEDSEAATAELARVAEKMLTWCAP